MQIGIALVLIFVLYLIDKHNRWRQVLKLAIGLVVLGLIVILPLLVSARQQQSVKVPTAQTAKKATAPPPSQEGQIKRMEFEIATLRSQIVLLGTYLRSTSTTPANDSDIEELRSKLEDKADDSDLRKLKSDLDDKADKRDLDDKADKSEMNGLASKVDDLGTFKQRFCSAINYSLVMNGTSTTPSGAGLWNACH